MIKENNGKTRILPPETIFLFLIVSISLFGDSSLYVLLPLNAASLGISVGMVGILLSTNRFVRLFTNYAVSALHVRLGSFFMVTASIMITALTTLIYGLPVGWVVLFLARIAWGFCWSSLRYESFDSITRNTDENLRGRASGMFYSITRIGSLAALLICGIIVEYVGYRRTFFIFALITLVLGLAAILFWSRSHRRSHQSIPASDMIHIENKLNLQPPFKPTQAGNTPERHTRIRPIFCYSLTFINGWIGSGLLITTVGYVMMLKYGQHLSILGLSIGISMAASFLTSTNWFHSIFLSVVFGRLSDKYGRARVLMIICLIHIVSLFTIAYSSWLFLFALAATVSFAATVGLNSILTAVTLDIHCQTDHNEHVIAHQTTFIDLGSALGALFGLYLVASIGYKATYTVSAMILAGIVVFLLYDMSLSLHGSKIQH